MTSRVLVGDVGGTSARFAIALKDADGQLKLEHYQKQENDQFESLKASLLFYVSQVDTRVDSALLAVAGPIERDGSSQLVNRDWPQIMPGELQTAIGCSSVKLVNDFAAMSRAVPEMQAADFVEILPGNADPTAPVLVTGPGTGFGIGTLIPLPSGGYHVLTGEGGHAAYAAHTVREAELAERLMAEHGYVPTELVVAGVGLQPVFDVLSDMHRVARRDLSPAEIMEAAGAGDPVCLEVCELRARSIMGAVGDGVLINGAKGGAVLTGGVAERMVKWLRAPGAIARFYERGSHSAYMQDVPVRVMVSAEAPLIGAAALMFDGMVG